MNKTEKQTLDPQLQKTPVSKSAFLEDFATKSDYFINQKTISMFTFLQNYIQKSNNNLFDLNAYSNTSNLHNAELMLSNYKVFLFLLENLQSLKNKEFELFLNLQKWECETFVFDGFDFNVLKLNFLHCQNYDFSDKQIALFEAVC